MFQATDQPCHHVDLRGRDSEVMREMGGAGRWGRMVTGRCERSTTSKGGEATQGMRGKEPVEQWGPIGQIGLQGGSPGGGGQEWGGGQEPR